jgi:putative DNA-invertase from lambdoid prophage Rac
LKLIASLRSKTRDAAAFAWKHHPDANQVLAVATIILVVLAYMALKDTEDTLELSERAWVGPADAKIDAVPQEGKEVKATVSVRNTGREPALDFTWDIKPIVATAAELAREQLATEHVEACFRLEPVRRIQVLYPSAGFGSGFDFSNTIPKELIDDHVVDGTYVILVKGCVAYRTFSTVMRKPVMKVFGYVRVSTSEQAINGDSLYAQNSQVTGYAMMKGWEIADIFIEAGVSGSVPLAARPQGQRLLAILKPGDAVVTPKLDRMFRSASDALGTLEEMKEQRISLHMIDLGGDVCGNGISKLVFTILSAVAENERDRIRERIRDVKRHLASQGVYGGGNKPFGYDVVDGRLVPNMAEQKALANMRKLRAAGMSFQKIGEEHGKKAMTVKRILDRAIVNEAL